MVAAHWHNVVKVALVGAIALGISACASGYEPNLEGCFVGKAFHKTGASFPAADGCNTCSCTQDGRVACTEIACAPEEKTCVRGGCSSQLCVDDGSNISGTCEWREEYGCFAQAACERQADGRCGHTPSKELDACLTTTGNDCTYNGERHKTGESFPSTDACNTCSCGPSGVACTKKLCVPDEPAPTECIRTGCSGQICAETDVVSTCEYQPQYECYQNAPCERQNDGQCGFSPTDELMQCLAMYGS